MVCRRGRAGRAGGACRSLYYVGSSCCHRGDVIGFLSIRDFPFSMHEGRLYGHINATKFNSKTGMVGREG